MFDPVSETSYEENSRKSMSVNKGSLDGRDVVDLNQQQEKDACKLCAAGCATLFSCNIPAACSFWLLACFGLCSSND